MRLVISSAKFSDPLLVLNNHSCEKASLVLSVSLAISFYHSFSLCLSVSIYLLPRRLTKVPGTVDRPVECAGEQHWRRPGNSIVGCIGDDSEAACRALMGVFCGAVCHRSPPAQRRKDQGVSWWTTGGAGEGVPQLLTGWSGGSWRGENVCVCLIPIPVL